MHIKSVKFNSVVANEGCTCDRCGQYIKNIWTVEYTEGARFNYGIDCFEKVQKSGLNATGIKAMKKILKSIEGYYTALEEFKTRTEGTDESWKTEQADWNRDSYWHGREYSEYKDWMINEFFPNRIASKEKELERFKKVNFVA